ncbi:uncharacterized protein NKAPD1 isoform X1 [Fundulus heteroclitus]|uniref:uncharacterized protein NKAPD1 isoform X1 n=1 Tax=Fundulus heteroclitus TaxID=8078 RepID=UPI00165BC912|nr:uncharacterized protein NKAPD1 isoform X1 [Fundulus heteroclitus]
MSKQPLGKTLLRNVIRHTDAHNKIQEETEMWKMRDWEIQTSDHKHLPNANIMRTFCIKTDKFSSDSAPLTRGALQGGHMHCDRVPDQSRNLSSGRERVSEHDDREARYWTRKLYEFEAGDPDRWGHSGFKELYPEEFDSDSDKSFTLKKTGRRKMKRSKSDTEECLSKRSKKSSLKKKKKKKNKDGKKKKEKSSSNDSGTDDKSDTKDKHRKKKRAKGRHKTKKSVKARRREEDSSSGDGNSDGIKGRRTKSRKKRKQDSLKDSDSELESNKKRRKNWRAAGEESSGGSSTD